MPLHLQLKYNASKSLLKGLVAFLLVAALGACADGGSSGGDSFATSRDDSNSSNEKAILFEGVAIEIGDEWLYRKGTSAAASDWMTAGFDDTTWLPGNTGLGYGDGDDETILSDMPGNYTTVYTRKVLDYDGSFNINSLMLEIGYDDGFVAYINGQEVARANMPAGQPSFNTQASTAIDPTTGFYDLSSFIGLIGNGDNVLAIEVHNASITSSDLSFLPRLIVNMGVSQPPVVTITSGGGTYIVGNTVTLTGTATDAEDGTITGNLAWSSSIDGPIPGNGGSVSTNTLSLGTHTITASVIDSDGNSDSDTASVTISLTPPPPQPPVVTITSGGGTYIVGNAVTLTGTATDAEDGTITGNLAWSSSIDGPIPGNGGSVSTNTLSLGTHTITASVTDSDGNSALDTIFVTVDAPVNNPPLVTITSGGGTYIQGNTVILTGSATDAEDGTITGNLAWSSSIDGSIPGSGGSVSTNALSLGTHTITSSVIDSDGNSESDTASVTISESGGGLEDCFDQTYYVATVADGGSDANDGSAGSEWATFSHALANMQAGDRLIIRDGSYTEDLGTWEFDNGVQVPVSNPPSGDAACHTTIAAENDGGAIINGDFFIGNDYIDFEGLRFVSSDQDIGAISGNHINIRRTSFHGDQDDPTDGLVAITGSHVLVEDSWVSGEGSYGFLAGSGASDNPNTGHHITFRRVVVSLKDFTGTRGFKGIILYGAKDIIIENTIIIDFGVVPDNGFGYSGGIRSRRGYGAHTHNFYGSLVLNNPFDGYLVTVGGCENCIAWDTAGRGIVQSNQGTGTSGHDFHKVTVGDTGGGILNYSHDYTNALVLNSGGDSDIGGNYNQFFNSPSSFQGSNALNSDPQISFIPRIEAGSSAFKSGLNSETRGAEMMYQYIDGVQTDTPLWPWRYETRLKKEMCIDTGVTTGFCAAGTGLYGGPITLTSYIWEYLGNACPSDIC